MPLVSPFLFTNHICLRQFWCDPCLLATLPWYLLRLQVFFTDWMFYLISTCLLCYCRGAECYRTFRDSLTVCKKCKVLQALLFTWLMYWLVSYYGDPGTWHTELFGVKTTETGRTSSGVVSSTLPSPWSLWSKQLYLCLACPWALFVNWSLVIVNGNTGHLYTMVKN